MSLNGNLLQDLLRKQSLCELLFITLDVIQWNELPLLYTVMYECEFLILCLLFCKRTRCVLQMALRWVSCPGRHPWLWWPSPSRASSPLSSSCWPASAARRAKSALRWVCPLCSTYFNFLSTNNMNKIWRHEDKLSSAPSHMHTH